MVEAWLWVLISLAVLACAGPAENGAGPDIPDDTAVPTVTTAQPAATTAPPEDPTAAPAATEVPTDETEASPPEAPPTATDSSAAGIRVDGIPPRFEGDEADLGPPLRAGPIDPAQLGQAAGSWTLGNADLSSLERYEDRYLPHPSEPGWMAVCLTYTTGGEFCDVAWAGPAVATIVLEGDGLTSITCADGTMVSVSDIERTPTAEVC